MIQATGNSVGGVRPGTMPGEFRPRSTRTRNLGHVSGLSNKVVSTLRSFSDADAGKAAPLAERFPNSVTVRSQAEQLPGSTQPIQSVCCLRAAYSHDPCSSIASVVRESSRYWKRIRPRRA